MSIPTPRRPGLTRVRCVSRSPLPNHTVACQDRDFAEWHGGCTHALVWAALVDVDDVRSAVCEARGRLAEVLLPRYDRQPHVTVAYAGLLPAEGTDPIEEPIGPGRLASDIHALRALADGGFTLSLDGWGSFHMVPYLSVEAPALDTAHQALHPAGLPGPYVPHVTVGHYSVSGPMPRIASLLDGWEPEPVELTVREWSLLAYETRDIAGPLTVVGSLSLDDGRWRTHADLPGLDLD